MQKLDIGTIRVCELNILLQFDKFCRHHNLVYYLAGGTLLGAIRHRGFIPWDDDIDVCMPRTDYLKFIYNFDGWNQYLKVKSNELGNLDANFSKIIDIRTIIKSKYSLNNVDTHLCIDVFPVDGLPNDINEVATIYKRNDFYRRVLFLCDSKLGEGRTIFRRIAKYILKPLANLYGKQRCIDNIEKIAAKYPYESSKYVGAVTGGLYGVGERMLKSEFEQSVEVEFEGYWFPAFSCWDSYLKGLYGDYMQLPPVEKRKNHDMLAFSIIVE